MASIQDVIDYVKQLTRLAMNVKSEISKLKG